MFELRTDGVAEDGLQYYTSLGEHFLKYLLTSISSSLFDLQVTVVVAVDMIVVVVEAVTAEAEEAVTTDIKSIIQQSSYDSEADTTSFLRPRIIVYYL